MIKGINHFAVITCEERFEETIKFWGYLGFKINPGDKPKENEIRKIFHLSHSIINEKLELICHKSFLSVRPDKTNKKPHIGFEVDNILEYKKDMEKMGAEIKDLKETSRGFIFTVLDPNQEPVEFCGVV